MPKPNLYTVGGTVQAGGGLYIARKADEDMLNLSRAGTFAYVLTSRQVGKSSLMVRTAEQLVKEGIRSLMIDLTGLGSKVTEEAWYLGLLTDIGDKFYLNTDVVTWWRNRSELGAAQRLTQFFREVVLTKVAEPVVIFVDEIDSTLGLPFIDDFYAAIRFLYNSRATVLEFRRLSFVLIGVATPSDLISDPKRTPFNIGQRVDITDFTYQEALPLADGFDMPQDEAGQVLQWVMKWTGGHPYLTQRLCRVIAEQYRANWTEPEVDRTVANTFFGKMSEHDNNLQFVRDMLTKRAPDKLAVLSTYKDIRLGRSPIRDEEQSPIKSHLKLSGVVKRENGKLAVRNPIYREVFDRGWIQEYWPVGWWQTVPASVKITSGVIVILAIVLLVLYVRADRLATQKNKLANDYQKIAESLKVKNDSLQTALVQVKAANTIAEAKTIEAQTQTEKANQATEQERWARLEHEKERQRADEQARIAEKNKVIADAQRDSATTRSKEIERRSLIEKARALALQARQELLQSGNEDLAALLARQAFLLNKKHAGALDNEIYQSLLKILNRAGGPFLLQSHAYAVKTVASHPDSPWVASASEDGTIQLWNLQQPNKSFMTLLGHTSGVRTVAFSPNGKWLASGSDDHTVSLWELRGNSYKSETLKAHTGGVWTVAFSPDGNRLASGGADTTVRLWNLRQSPLSAKLLPKPEARVRGVAFSPDGRTLAAACDDGNIRLYDLRQPEQNPKVLPGHKGRVNAVAFSPDGQTLASAGNDFTVRLWNWRAANPNATILRGHETYANTVVFSRDGRMLASGSQDGKVFLWKWRESTDSPFLVLENGKWVFSVAFSSDGRWLVAGCDDKTVRLWYTQTEPLADIVCARIKRNLSRVEWDRFLGKDIPYDATCANLPPGKAATSGSSSSSNR